MKSYHLLLLIVAGLLVSKSQSQSPCMINTVITADTFQSLAEYYPELSGLISVEFRYINPSYRQEYTAIWSLVQYLMCGLQTYRMINQTQTQTRCNWLTSTNQCVEQESSHPNPPPLPTLEQLLQYGLKSYCRHSPCDYSYPARDCFDSCTVYRKKLCMWNDLYLTETDLCKPRSHLLLDPSSNSSSSLREQQEDHLHNQLHWNVQTLYAEPFGVYLANITIRQIIGALSDVDCKPLHDLTDIQLLSGKDGSKKQYLRLTPDAFEMEKNRQGRLLWKLNVYIPLLLNQSLTTTFDPIREHYDINKYLGITQLTPLELICPSSSSIPCALRIILGKLDTHTYRFDLSSVSGLLVAEIDDWPIPLPLPPVSIPIPSNPTTTTTTNNNDNNNSQQATTSPLPTGKSSATFSTDTTTVSGFKPASVTLNTNSFTGIFVIIYIFIYVLIFAGLFFFYWFSRSIPSTSTSMPMRRTIPSSKPVSSSSSSKMRRCCNYLCCCGWWCFKSKQTNVNKNQ